jgi:hypothetical protein
MSRGRGVVLVLAGWLLWAAGATVTLGGFGLVGFGHFFTSGRPWWQLFTIFPAMLAGAVVVDAGQRTRLAGRRHLARPATMPGPDDLFVLYLRSFREDAGRARLERTWLRPEALQPALHLGPMLFSGRSLEEHLVAVLRPLGRVIAVARPGQVLPPAGARRLTLPANDWQGPVREMMSRARLVVIFLDASTWTLWEFAEAIRCVPPQRLLLVAPEERKDYEAFRRAAGATLPVYQPPVRHPPLKEPSASGLIFFDADRTPHFQPLVANPLHDVLGSALRRSARPALDRLRAYENALPESRDRVRIAYAARANIMAGLRNGLAIMVVLSYTGLTYRTLTHRIDPPQGTRGWAGAIGAALLALGAVLAITAMLREVRRRAVPPPSRVATDPPPDST